MDTKSITVSASADDQKVLAKLMKRFDVKVSVTHIFRLAIRELAKKEGSL